MAETIATLVIQLGLILFFAKIFGMGAAKLKIPSVMGELVAGVVLGPFCLGGIGLPFAGFETGLFPKCTVVPGIPVDPTLYAIATLGSIVLLFNSGLETDVRTFFKYSVAGTVVGIGGIVISFLFGAAVGIFALGWTMMDPRTLFLGILCTATSVGISARILSEHHAMGTPEGVTIMAAAVIDDVLGIVCLAVVIGIANVELQGGSMNWGRIGWITVRSFGIWLGVTALGLAISTRIASFLKWFKGARFFAIQAFGFSMLLAGLFEKAGLAMIIGAFVMGLSLSKTDVVFKIREALSPIYNFLVPIFFVVMGMLVDIRVLKDPSVLGIGLLFSLMAALGKVVGCSFPALAMNFNAKGALRIGIGMVPRCEVGLIIAGIAATTLMKDPATGGTMPIFDSRLFGIAIIMPLVTALLAPPLLEYSLRLKGKGVHREVEEKGQVVTTFDFHTDVIAYFAFNQIIELLHHDGFAYSTLGRGVSVVQFRKDKTIFSLDIQGTKFVFTSSEEEAPLIRTTIYESVVEMHKSLSELRRLAAPDTVKSALNGDSPCSTKPVTKKKKTVQALTLERMITRKNVLVGLHATTKEEVFRALIDDLRRNARLADPDRCLRDLMEREQISSTYQEHGIAMPHARTEGTTTFATAIAVLPEGIEYDEGNSDRRARIVILSLCPKDEPGPYLQFIAQVAQLLTQETRRAAILAAKTSDEAARIFHG